jgi:hypothetical protein
MLWKNWHRHAFLINFALFIISFEAFIKHPQKIWLILLGLLLCFLLETTLLASNKTDTTWWSFIIFPSTLSLATFGATTLQSDLTIIRLLGLASAWLIASFFHKTGLFINNPRKYRQGSLEFLADYGNLYTVSLLALSFYGLNSYLEMKPLVLLSLLIPLLWLIFYHFFWSNKLEIKKFKIHILLGGIIIGELAWALTSLPFSFVDLALLLTISFYSLSHLQKLLLQAKLTGEKLRYYFSLLILGYILIFFSTHWL